ncbi:hypothetical protein GCM10022205_41700 [Spinactinospora alkalitolerans]
MRARVSTVESSSTPIARWNSRASAADSCVATRRSHPFLRRAATKDALATGGPRTRARVGTAAMRGRPGTLESEVSAAEEVSPAATTASGCSRIDTVCPADARAAETTKGGPIA